MATAAELSTRARRRADMVGSQFCSDAEILDYLSEEATALLPELIEINGEDRWAEVATVSVNTVGTGLPGTDIGRLLRVAWAYSGITYPLEPQDWRGTPTRRQQAWTPGSLPTYRLSYDSIGAALTLYFDPAPSSAQSVTIHYTPASVTFATGTDVNRWGNDELLVLGAAIRMLQKQESPVNELLGERDRLLQRLRIAPSRDLGRPKSIHRRRRMGAW